MKKTSFRLILAALAATAALVACTKEITPGKVDTDSVSPAAEGSRVITVSFGPKTRTTLDKNSLQPMFADGDSILLETVPDLNSPEAPQDTQTVAVTIDPTTQKATITTTLQGNLSAMYPARLARLLANGGYDIPVFGEQSGYFKDANICRALINAGATTAEFENAYSLFIITPPDETKKLTVRSLRAIGDDGQRTGEAAEINDFVTDLEYTVTVSTPILNMPDTTYYVALLSGACISDLSFEAWFDDDGTTGSIKGIPTSKIISQALALDVDDSEEYKIVAAGTAYEIDGNNWHEYVKIGDYKWATMNVGANAPEEIGDYFVWGATVKAYSDVNTTTNLFTFVSGNPYGDIYKNDWNAEVGYDWNNTPFTNGVYSDTTMQVFTKYTAELGDYTVGGVPDHKTILDLEDDAAHVNWGGAWRMPTKEEFNSFDKFNIQ